MNSHDLTSDDRQDVAQRIRKGFFPTREDINPVLMMLVHEFGLTTEFIASKLGIQQPNVSRWLNGKKPIPAVHMPALSELLKQTLDVAEAVLAEKKASLKSMRFSSDEIGFYRESLLKYEIDRLSAVVERGADLYLLSQVPLF